MNENYLKYYYDTMKFDYVNLYPPFNVNWLLENLLKTKDYSFLKQELKPMNFLSKKMVFTLNLENLTDEQITDFKSVLMESLRVPVQYLHNTDPINYFDEYH